MNKHLYIILFLFLALYSCEDIIQVDLRSVEPRIVIEGTITNQSEASTVRISKSTDYFEPSIYEMISGAVVIIKDDLNYSEVLKESEPGIYMSENIAAREGGTYLLEVTAEDQIYTAETRMGRVIPIDSITTEYIPGRGFFEDGFYIHCFFRDPPDEVNYYRVISYKNGEPDENINLLEDTFIDGRVVDFLLFSPSYQPGDTAIVDLIHISADVYDYYLTLNNVVTYQGGGSPSNPANPNTNISNGALGYFGALAANRESFVIEE